MAEQYNDIDEAKYLRKKKWLNIWDKVTTGILIVLLSSPICILAYIFAWFLSK